jgi:pimeloyl-ACP methyl ester carboxylesterase
MGTYVARTEARGDRGDLVIVPGLCVSAYLRPAADALADVGYRVHLVDPPGWPYSDAWPAPPGSASEVAGWVARWLVEADLRDVTLVGQSLGAQLAAHVAVQTPDRVRLLVLQGPTFDPAYRTIWRAAWRLLRDFPRERPSLLLVEAPEWLRVGLRQVLRMARLGLRDHLETTVRHVRCPVLVVVGEYETLASREWTTSLAESAAGSGDHVVMPGLPHSSPHADPEAFARLVLALSQH